MLTYGLAIADGGEQVDARVQAVLAERVPRLLPFTPRAHLRWADATESMVFGGWQDVSGERVGRHWHQSPTGLTALTGDPWPRGSTRWCDEASWASQLASNLADHPLSQGTEDLTGIFTALSLDAGGRGTVAADTVGFGHIYWGRTGNTTVISSRAQLAAQMLAGGREPPRDVLGAGWLAFALCNQGSSTTLTGVNVLPADARIEIFPRTGASLTPGRARFWTLPASAEDHSDLLEGIYDDIANGLHRAAKEPVEGRLAGLTGGRDSRTILAVMLAEGLSDAFDFETTGAPDLPDVLIAKEIAAMFGLRHRNGASSSGSHFRAARNDAMRANGHDLSERELGMRLQVGMSSGMRNLMHPIHGHPACGDQVLVSGFCGESLRSNYGKATWVTTREQAEQFPLVGLKYGGAGIFRPEADEHYRRHLHALVTADIDDGDAPLDILDAWYLRNRYRRWLGPVQELNAENKVYPLYSVRGIQTAHTLGPEERRADRIPYEIIRRAAPRLLDVPLHGGGWHERLAHPVPPHPASAADQPASRSSAARDAPARTAGAHSGQQRTPARTVGVDHRRARLEEDGEIMTRYFSDASNPIFEIIDQRAVVDRVRHFAQQPDTSRRQLYGALTAAIWLGGHELTFP